MKKSIALITVLSAVLAACGQGNDPGAEGTTPATELTESTVVESTVPPTEGSDSTAPGSTTPSAAGQSAEMVASAKQDLAKRLDIEEGQVTVVTQEEITWPDGSLGCPEDGMSYTQAVVDGILVIFEVDGQEYEYHGAVDGELTYCEDPAPRK